MIKYNLIVLLECGAGARMLRSPILISL